MEIIKNLFGNKRVSDVEKVNIKDITFSVEEESKGPSELGKLSLKMYGKNNDWIGSVSFDYGDSSLILKNVSIFEEYRNQGLSKLFLQHLIELAHSKNFKGVELGTSLRSENMAKSIKHFFPEKTLEQIISESKARTLGVITNF